VITSGSVSVGIAAIAAAWSGVGGVAERDGDVAADRVARGASQCSALDEVAELAREVGVPGDQARLVRRARRSIYCSI
jgi:hypothetical protein